MEENRSIHQGPRIGRRLLGREARLTRASGLRLGRAVAARHERPEPVRAAMRLVPKKAGVARAATPAPAPAADQWVASATESTIVPGISDWGAEWLFGDSDEAIATGRPFMGGAGVDLPTPEEKRVARTKRGGLEVGRAARILEGDEEPAAAAGPARVSRSPAEAPASTPAPPDPAPTKRRVARTPGRPPASTAAPEAAAPSPPAVARSQAPGPATPPARPAVARSDAPAASQPAPPTPAASPPAASSPTASPPAASSPTASSPAAPSPTASSPDRPKIARTPTPAASPPAASPPPSTSPDRPKVARTEAPASSPAAT